MALVVKRHANESWRDCCIRYATRYGMEEEVLASFNHNIVLGLSHDKACWEALYEWDLLEFQP